MHDNRKCDEKSRIVKAERINRERYMFGLKRNAHLQSTICV